MVMWSLFKISRLIDNWTALTAYLIYGFSSFMNVEGNKLQPPFSTFLRVDHFIVVIRAALFTNPMSRGLHMQRILILCLLKRSKSDMSKRIHNQIRQKSLSLVITYAHLRAFHLLGQAQASSFSDQFRIRTRKMLRRMEGLNTGLIRQFFCGYCLNLTHYLWFFPFIL